MLKEEEKITIDKSDYKALLERLLELEEIEAEECGDNEENIKWCKKELNKLN